MKKEKIITALLSLFCFTYSFGQETIVQEFNKYLDIDIRETPNCCHNSKIWHQEKSVLDIKNILLGGISHNLTWTKLPSYLYELTNLERIYCGCEYYLSNLLLDKRFNTFSKLKVIDMGCIDKIKTKNVNPMPELVFFRGQSLSKIPDFVYQSPKVKFLEYAPGTKENLEVDKLAQMDSLRYLNVNLSLGFDSKKVDELLEYLEKVQFYTLLKHLEYLNLNIGASSSTSKMPLGKIAKMTKLKDFHLPIDVSIQLEELSLLQQMEYLSVGGFSSKEWAKLAEVLKKMPNLKEFTIYLKVKDRKEIHDKTEEVYLQSLVPNVKIYIYKYL